MFCFVMFPCSSTYLGLATVFASPTPPGNPSAAYPPSQVRYDPDATGPRHLLAAVQGVGFTAEPYAEQRLGELREGWAPVWAGRMPQLGTPA